MTMQGRELGFESCLYVNAGTYGSPDWKEVDLARDLTDVRDQAEVDVTTRGVASRGFQAAQAGTTPWGFDFDMLVPAAGESNDAFTALITALKARSAVDVLHVEGGPLSTDGLNAERAICAVVGGGKGEPLADASTRSLRLRFTPNAEMDNPLTGTTAGGAFVENS